MIGILLRRIRHDTLRNKTSDVFSEMTCKILFLAFETELVNFGTRCLRLRDILAKYSAAATFHFNVFVANLRNPENAAS